MPWPECIAEIFWSAFTHSISHTDIHISVYLHISLSAIPGITNGDKGQVHHELFILIQLSSYKPVFIARLWWRTPLIPALGRQKQVDICEFKASLAYKS